jgi:hypothetical protein
LPYGLAAWLKSQLLSPSLHNLEECINILLITRVDGFLILANLSNLRTSSNVCQTEITLVELEMNGASDLAF